MSRILLAISNGLKIGNNFFPSGFMEQIVTELSNCGNSLLVYVPNRYQSRIFSGNNEIKEGIDVEKLKFRVKEFDPDLIIAFNNTIFNEVVNITSCPIVVWGADSDLFWNSQDVIKQNLERYYFFCFSEKEMGPRQIKYGCSNDRIHLVKPATNIRNINLKKNKNISFIGNCFSSNVEFTKFIDEYRGTKELDILMRNFSKFFYMRNDLFENIEDKIFKEKFLKLRYDSYETFFSGEKRIITLNAISDLGLHIWGNDGWNRIQTFLPSLFACVHKNSVTSVSENETVYNESKISTNINHDQSTFGINFRVCDILASSSCLISSYSPYLLEAFKNVGLIMFDNPFDARKLCIKYLNNDQLRNEYVQKCNVEIDRAWRWSSRFDEISSILNIPLKNTGFPNLVKKLLNVDLPNKSQSLPGVIEYL